MSCSVILIFKGTVLFLCLSIILALHVRRNSTVVQSYLSAFIFSLCSSSVFTIDPDSCVKTIGFKHHKFGMVCFANPFAHFGF